MLEILVLGLFAALVFVFWLYYNSRAEIKKIIHDKQSLSVKYGKMTEQFFPFMKDYKYDPAKFRFLGTPIDGVQFEDDRVIFIEFKTGKGELSELQRKIKHIVESKKVDFEEIKIKYTQDGK